jgi:hypothetical protein
VSRPLVIDPVLVYATYLGGSGDDSGGGIAVDKDGQAYVTGGPLPSTSRPRRAPFSLLTLAATPS